MGGGGVGVEARQVKLYLRLAGAQKRQKCKFVPRLLSMIVDWGAEMKTNWDESASVFYQQ